MTTTERQGGGGPTMFRAGIKQLANSKVARFILVGGSNTVLGFILVNILFYAFDMFPEAAILCGFIFGLIYTYVLNKHFTFKSKRPHTPGEFGKYAGTVALSYVASVALTRLTLAIGVPFAITQVLAIGLVAVMNFLIFDRFVFKNNNAVI